MVVGKLLSYWETIFFKCYVTVVFGSVDQVISRWTDKSMSYSALINRGEGMWTYHLQKNLSMSNVHCTPKLFLGISKVIWKRDLPGPSSIQVDTNEHPIWFFWVKYYLNLDPILLSKSLPDAFHFSWDKPHPEEAMLRLVLLSSALLRKGDDEVLQMPKEKSWGSFVGLLQEYVEFIEPSWET